MTVATESKSGLQDLSTASAPCYCGNVSTLEVIVHRPPMPDWGPVFACRVCVEYISSRAVVVAELLPASKLTIARVSS